MRNTFNFITVNTEFQTTMSPTKTALSIRHTSEPPDKMPKRHSVLTNGPQSHTHVRIDWQKAQTVLCAQKRCLPCHALVDLLSLRAPQFIRMHVSVPWRSTHQLAVSAKQGRNSENPLNKRFHQLPGTFPPKPLWELASQEQWPPHSLPRAPSIMAIALQVVGGWW